MADLALLRMTADMPVISTGIEAELAMLPHLTHDLRFVQRRVAGTFRECLAAQAAANVLQAIPGPRECTHMLISGRFALADFVPAVLLLAAPAKIRSLHIATLGFSKRNISALCRLLDVGDIGSLRLLLSHYFKHTSSDIYQFGREELAKRPRTGFLSVRNHAKILCIKLTDGRSVVIETSANLRSCKNIEQMATFGDPALYRFHVQWIDELFIRAKRKDQNGQ